MSSHGEQKMSKGVSQHILSAAEQWLQNNGHTNEVVEIPLGEHIHMLLSPRPGDLIAQAQVTHDGKTYHLGLTRH